MAVKYEINVTGNATEKLKKIAEGTEPIAEGFKEAAKEAKELERAAKKTLDSIQTPQERYNKKLEDLGKLYKAGKIDLDQYNRALQKQKEDLHGVGRASESIGDIAKKWIAVGSAIAAARKLLQLYAEEQQKAAASAMEAELPLEKLQAVAKSPEDMDRLVQQTMKFARGGAVGKNTGLAADIIVEARNAGLSDSDLATMRGAAETGIIGDVPQAIRDITGFQMTLGSAKGMTGTQLMNMALGAQAVGKATSGQLLQQGMRATGAATTLGLSPQEVMALEAVLVSGAHTPEAGGERAAGLLKALSLKPQFVGKPLAQSIREIQAMGMSPAELKKFLGEDTALAGFQSIEKNLPMFEASMQEGVSGAQRDLVAERGAFGMRNDVIRAARMRRAAEGREAVETLRFSARENERAAIAANSIANTAEFGSQGQTAVQRNLQEFNQYWLGGSPGVAQAIGNLSYGAGPQPNQTPPIVDAINNQTKSLLKNKATAPAVPTNP